MPQPVHRGILAPCGIPQTESRLLLGMRVDATSYEAVTRQVLLWAKAGESRYVCEAPVRMVMEAHDHPDYRQMINAADIVTPGGMPVVWTLRRLGLPRQPRVYGPEITLRVCRAAALEGIPVGFYGTTDPTLRLLIEKLRRRFPELEVTFSCAPPFRPLNPDEDAAVVKRINQSGCRVLCVGLGCPKQERWMALHRGRVQAVMLGVGAAFDFISGVKKQAPLPVQRLGLEWAFRLAAEPRRLWHRYLYYNPRFVFLIARQLMHQRRPGPTGCSPAPLF
jgi:N-acetylglucosaminyldiphosphoundecaprenol N-acetyl-beta-D-mannosaminyltransferase